MDFGLTGKRVVVSGAANGIGSAIFYLLLKEGAFPIGIDLQNLGGSELEKLIRNFKIETSKDYWFFRGDASNWRDVKRFAESLKNIDGLVNNAGLLGGDNSHGGRNSANWIRVMKANAGSALCLTEHLFPKMKGGSIVNIGSIELEMAAPGVVLYTASKSALWGLTVGYANTLAKHGIRVNMVSPGNVNTERNMAQYVKSPEIIQGFEGKTPLKRSVEPDEVANLVLFLLSDKAKAITGQNYIIDCGYTRASRDPSWKR